MDALSKAASSFENEAIFSIGQAIEARFGGKANYFKGTIVAHNSDGSYEIKYDDGDVEKAVAAELIRTVQVDVLGGLSKAAISLDNEVQFKVGQEVEARFGGKAKYFKGTIVAHNSDGSYEIKYDDGDAEKAVAAELIRTVQVDVLGGLSKAAISLDNEVQFKVGQEVEARFGGKAKYFKGTVVAHNSDGSYEIKYDDGDVEKAVAAELIRKLETDSTITSTPIILSTTLVEPEVVNQEVVVNEYSDVDDDAHQNDTGKELRSQPPPASLDENQLSEVALLLTEKKGNENASRFFKPPDRREGIARVEHQVAVALIRDSVQSSINQLSKQELGKLPVPIVIAYEGDIQRWKKLLYDYEGVADLLGLLNHCDIEGRGPLHYAAAKGHFDLIQLMLSMIRIEYDKRLKNELLDLSRKFKLTINRIWGNYKTLQCKSKYNINNDGTKTDDFILEKELSGYFSYYVLEAERLCRLNEINSEQSWQAFVGFAIDKHGLTPLHHAIMGERIERRNNSKQIERFDLRTVNCVEALEKSNLRANLKNCSPRMMKQTNKNSINSIHKESTDHEQWKAWLNHPFDLFDKEGSFVFTVLSPPSSSSSSPKKVSPKKGWVNAGLFPQNINYEVKDGRKSTSEDIITTLNNTNSRVNNPNIRVKNRPLNYLQTGNKDPLLFCGHTVDESVELAVLGWFQRSLARTIQALARTTHSSPYSVVTRALDKEDRARKGSLNMSQLKAALEAPPLCLHISNDSLQAVAWQFRWRGHQGHGDIEVDVDALVDFILEGVDDGSDDDDESSNDGSDDSRSGEFKSSTTFEESKDDYPTQRRSKHHHHGPCEYEDEYEDEWGGESKDQKKESIRGSRHKKMKKKWKLSKRQPAAEAEPKQLASKLLFTQDSLLQQPMQSKCSHKQIISSHIDALNLKEKTGMSPIKLASLQGFAHTVKFLIRLGASRDDDSQLLTDKKPNHERDVENGVENNSVMVSALELTNSKAVVRALLDGGLKKLQRFTDEAHRRLSPISSSSGNNDSSATKQVVVQDDESSWAWLKSLSLCSDPDTMLNELGDPLMRSPLHFAAIAGLEEWTCSLLESGVDVDSLDTNGWTPLQVACLHGGSDRTRVAELLLDYGADIERNTLGTKRTPLSIAAAAAISSSNPVEEDVEIVKLLVRRGASLNPVDKNGFTPLLSAAVGARPKCLSFLLTAGANVYSTTSQGANILHLAIQGNSIQHSVCVSLLCDWDAEVSLLKRCVNNRGLIPRALIGSFSSTLSHTSLETTWECARDCNVSELRRLSEQGKPLDAKGQLFGVTPLHMAILGPHSARILLELSGRKQPNTLKRHDKDNDEKDLRIRTISSAKRILLLIERKQNSKQGSRSSSSLSPSLLKKQSSLLYGAQESSSEQVHEVALRSTLSFLLSTCKVYVDPSDLFGRTPLMLAPIAAATESTATSLLRAGADVGATDIYGNTPLHYAYAFCKSRLSGSPTTLISLLLAAGASPCVTNMEGHTPKAVMGLRHKICVEGENFVVKQTRRTANSIGNSDNINKYASTMFT